ncbi:bifunctional diguanylate cyclase/phosphodiesterase [Cupriavidus pauculus]
MPSVSMTERHGRSKKATTRVFLPLVYVGAVIGTLVTGLVAYEINDSRTQALNDASRDLTVLSSASAAQLKSYLDSIGEVLSAAGLASQSLLTAGPGGADNALSQVRAAAVGTAIEGIVVVGKAGVPVLHTYDDPVPASFLPGQLAVQKLEYQRTAGTEIVGPILSDSGDRVKVYAVKRINDQTGAFLGAVLTPLDISSIALVGKEALRKDGVTVAVLGAERGNLVARLPDPGVLRYLKQYTETEISPQMAGKQSGVAVGASAVDGVRRLMAFERVKDYPLLVVTSMDEQVVNSEWHADAKRIIGIGYASLSVIALLLVVMHRQLRQLMHRTEAVTESEQRFDRVVQRLTDGLYVRDKAGKLLVANRQFATFFGASDERALVGADLATINPQATSKSIARLNDQVFSSRGKPYILELETESHDGRMVPMEYTLSAVEIGGVDYILGQMRDITARRQYESRLVKQATFDEITGLPNRRLYMDRLSNALHRAKRDGRNVAVMFVDLDHFKRVNDTLGHRTGDQLLVAAAERLTSLVRDGDTIARFGGDEFVVLLAEVTSPLECRLLAERIVEEFRTPFELAGRRVSVTASVGVAVAPGDGAEPDLLLQHADTAMYEAKSGGRSGFRFFNNEMNVRVHEMLQIDGEIRFALERNEMRVLYQPIVDPIARKVVKAEALARWESTRLGSVSPDKFIPAAEENGTIAQIGDWVLSEACRTAALWARDLPEPIAVSVNVSAKQFNDPRFVDSVFSALDESGLPAHLLELELTERILISDDETAFETIAALREMGVGLSLDDFGTGYSSLSYLTRFPLNTIKIDRAFVSGLAEDSQTQNLTKAIIALAKSLDLQLVAEGVETADQARVLIAYGCDLQQGYLYGRPAEPSAILNPSWG